MTGLTKEFGFLTIDDVHDRLDAQGWKFGVQNRLDLDRLLAALVEGHHHDGRSPDQLSEATPPTLALAATGGTLPAGTDVLYRYALVDDRGHEGPASIVYHAQMRHSMQPPGDFPVVPSTGGTLLPGQYTYWITAYNDESAQETIVSPSKLVTVPIGGQVTITFPTSYDSAQTGWNVYRRGPGDVRPNFLATNADITTLTYVDTGATASDVNRTIPSANTTFSRGAVTFTPFTIPAHFTWKLYRTYDPLNWNASLLYWGNAVSHVDKGYQRTTGTPITQGKGLGGAPKIDLTDTAEVTGTLPPGRVVHYTTATFTFPGLLQPQLGAWHWVNEFERAEIVAIRMDLGIGAAPVAQALQMKPTTIRAADVSSTQWTETAYVVGIGNQSGGPFVIADEPLARLAQGDALSVDITQTGGGATPGDYDLTVQFLLVVRGLDQNLFDVDNTILGN